MAPASSRIQSGGCSPPPAGGSRICLHSCTSSGSPTDSSSNADTEPVAEELLGAAPPDATVVDQVLHRELLAEAQRLQEDLNNRKIERKNKQEKFDQLQMSLQMISAEKAPSTATEVSANALEY